MTSYLAACCCDDDTGGPACATWASFDFEFTITASQNKRFFNLSGQVDRTDIGSCSGDVSGTVFLRTSTGLGNFNVDNIDDVDRNLIINSISHSGNVRIQSLTGGTSGNIISELAGDPTRVSANIREGFGLDLYQSFSGEPNFLPNVGLPDEIYGRRMGILVIAPHRYRVVDDEFGDIIDSTYFQPVPFGPDGIFGSAEYRTSLNTLQEIGTEEIGCDPGTEVYSGRSCALRPLEPWSPASIGIPLIDGLLLPYNLSGTIVSTDAGGDVTSIMDVTRQASGGCSNVQFYEEDPRP